MIVLLAGCGYMAQRSVGIGLEEGEVSIIWMLFCRQLSGRSPLIAIWRVLINSVVEAVVVYLPSMIVLEL